MLRTPLHSPSPSCYLARAAALLLLTGAALVAALHPASAFAQGEQPARVRTATQAGPQDPRWTAIRRSFGQEGKAEEGYFRVEFPRSDLRVRIGDVTLETPFELTSYFGFAPVGSNDVLAMGEVIMVQEEVNRALVEARRQGVNVAALHNHLLGEDPRIIFMHIVTEGPAEAVATKLRAIIAKTNTPLQPVQRAEMAKLDWSAIDAILGPHSEAEGRTASYTFPRREEHTIHGVRVKSNDMLETATEVVFQQLEDGRMASGGELYLRPEEVQPVIDALESAGLHVTALHNHMLDEQPKMYWMHWYGTGEGVTLARGVAAALARTNSERRASS